MLDEAKASFLEDMEAEKQAAILRAEAKRESMIREAEGQAEAIRMVQQATADGIRMLVESNPNKEVIALKRVTDIRKMDSYLMCATWILHA